MLGRQSRAAEKERGPNLSSRILASHERELTSAKDRNEPAGQIAAREIELVRIGAALRRADEPRWGRCGCNRGRCLLQKRLRAGLATIKVSPRSGLTLETADSGLASGLLRITGSNCLDLDSRVSAL